MIRFLRLFRQFRDLEVEREHLVAQRDEAVSGWRLEIEDLQKARTERDAAVARMTKLEEEAAAWKATAEKWQTEYLTTNKDSIKARETVADWVSQLRFGIRIFDHAPILPDKKPADFQPIMKDRVQMRARVQQMEKDFESQIKEWQDKMFQRPAPSPGVADLGIEVPPDKHEEVA